MTAQVPTPSQTPAVGNCPESPYLTRDSPVGTTGKSETFTVVLNQVSVVSVGSAVWAGWDSRLDRCSIRHPGVDSTPAFSPN